MSRRTCVPTTLSSTPTWLVGLQSLLCSVTLAIGASCGSDGAPSTTTGASSSAGGAGGSAQGGPGGAGGAIGPGCTGPMSRVDGFVEAAVSATLGSPVENAKITFGMAQMPAAVTGADGKFTLPLPCGTTAYPLVATKVGFEPLEVSVVPSEDVVSAHFSLVRATASYRFVPLTVLDYTSRAPLGDVEITASFESGSEIYRTDGAGAATIPFPRGAGSQRLSFARAGYHPVVGDYVGSGPSWMDVSGIGRVTVSAVGITARMVDEGVASIPAPCVDNDRQCVDEKAFKLCINGDWQAPTKCQADRPFCNPGMFDGPSSCGYCSNAVRKCVDAHNIDACLDGEPIEIYCGQSTCVKGECM